MSTPAEHKPKRETLYEPRFPHPGIYLLPVLLLPTAFVALGLIVHRAIPGKFPEWPFPLVGALAALLGVAKWMSDIYRIRRILRIHGRFLCLNCHYPLKGLADSGNCPECDHPYDRATTERRWKMWEETVNKGKPMI
ncbi:MAG TPA: hypothetical protein VHC70_10580 [Phycisphaerales bacterium]|nr:hypothetical protein [Phycisphaerales bacterium]